MKPENPIVAVVREILLQQDGGLSEYDLLTEVKRRDPVFACMEKEDDRLLLFHRHFIVMNALYQLQDTLLTEQLYLTISALDIRLDKIDGETSQALVGDPANQKMREYYLNWDNLAQTSSADVQKLIASFWKYYLARDKRVEALQQIELPADADWQMVKRRYRQLAAMHHPDKGGDPEQFKRIREAYEILQRCQFD